MVLLLVGVLFLLEHFYTGNNAELLDWKPTRSPDLEVQNEMRRRRGVAERNEQKLRDEVAAEELERLRRRSSRTG